MAPNDGAGNGAAGAHAEHEDHPWTIQIPDHPTRKDSKEYIHARSSMNKMAKSVDGLFYGPPPYQDHHGGGLWLKDDQGWFVVRNLAGIEWSAQFCADPAKVDLLRQNARRLYAAFPDAVTELGIRELLDTPIVDADGIARWTDSICNASMPLEVAYHTGVLPRASTGGVHHYPSPIAEIELFKRDDFQLWVSDQKGTLAAVVPLAPRGSNDGRVRVLLAATESDPAEPTPLAALVGAHPAGPVGAHPAGPVGAIAGAAPELERDPTILQADHPLAIEAFALQNGPD
jgi:Family of unknown function (DUF6424)